MSTVQYPLFASSTTRIVLTTVLYDTAMFCLRNLHICHHKQAELGEFRMGNAHMHIWTLLPYREPGMQTMKIVTGPGAKGSCQYSSYSWSKPERCGMRVQYCCIILADPDGFNTAGEPRYIQLAPGTHIPHHQGKYLSRNTVQL